MSFHFVSLLFELTATANSINELLFFEIMTVLVSQLGSLIQGPEKVQRNISVICDIKISIYEIFLQSWRRGMFFTNQTLWRPTSLVYSIGLLDNLETFGTRLSLCLSLRLAYTGKCMDGVLDSNLTKICRCRLQRHLWRCRP